MKTFKVTRDGSPAEGGYSADAGAGANWLSASASGDTVTVVAQACTGAEGRTASVVVKGGPGDIPAAVEVTQAGAPPE